MQTYPSLNNFYDEVDPQLRRFSGEVDFGVQWTDPSEPHQIPAALPHWRVSWIINTGEVYAENYRTKEVRLYGTVEGRENIDAYLADWTDHCGLGGLAWIEDRFPDPEVDMEERFARQEQQHIEDRAHIGTFGQYVRDIPGME